MAQQLVSLATCNLNQWALDFDGNLERIRESIRISKAAGCRFRLGPELEIPGYGCEDHFLEIDTVIFSWDCLAELLSDDLTDDILCDVGLPAIHRGVTYNCRAFCLNRKVLAIRPKMYLANDGNYRETRWFTEWRNQSDDGAEQTEEFHLPKNFLAHFPQHPRTVPIGILVLRLEDCVLGSETCEELFTPDSPHISMGLDGVDIFANGSGSHHQLRKLDKRIDLIRSATAKSGGIYLYANQQGCDGGRCYYDGCAMIWENGKLLAQGSQFGLRDVEVQFAVADVTAVYTFRAGFKSRSTQAAHNRHKYPRVEVGRFIVYVLMRGGRVLSSIFAIVRAGRRLLVMRVESSCGRGWVRSSSCSCCRISRFAVSIIYVPDKDK